MTTPTYQVRVAIEGETEATFYCETAGEVLILREAIEAKHGFYCNVIVTDTKQNIRVY